MKCIGKIKDRTKRELNITSSAICSNGIERESMFDFENFPADIKNEVRGHLPPGLQKNLALTSSKHLTLFKPNFKSDLVSKLLVCVAWGKHPALPVNMRALAALRKVRI